MIKKIIIYISYITIVTLLVLNITTQYKEYNSLRQTNINLQKDLLSKNILINNKPDITDIKTKHQELENNILTKYNTVNIENINKLIETLNTSNNNLNKDIYNLNTEITNLKQKKESLTYQYNVLKKKKEEQSQNLFLINNVPTFNQYPNYPTGCESVALYILLRYHNINITVDNIINTLDKGSLPYIENNIRYGGNPYLEFVGNPYSYSSYGTYEYAISKVANQYKSGIINGTGKSLNQVLEIVSQNRPVLVWTSMGLSLPYISDSWKYKVTGETINWHAGEHAVVIVGYNNNSIIISDPIGGQIKYQNRSLFEQRYNYYGKRNLYY